MKDITFRFTTKTIVLLISILALPVLLKAQNQQYNSNNSTDYIVKHFRTKPIYESNNYFSEKLTHRINKWKAIPLDYKFFLEDSTTFSTQQSLTLKTDFRSYEEFALDLMYYTPRNNTIAYRPTLVKKELLYDDSGYLHRMETDFKKFNFGSPFDFRKHNEKIFIQRPELVHYIWAKIPSPHRMIAENKHLSRKSARDGIRNLLPENIDKPKKLEKQVEDSGPWTISGKSSIAFSQTYLENWTQGGENTYTIASDLKISATYKKDKIEWESYIRDKMGIISNESYPTQVNTDLFRLYSKYGIQASKKWYYSTLFNFESQLFNVKDDTIITSRLLSPAYFTLAFGMDFKKNANFTVMISPLTFKLNYVMDTVKVDQTDYSIDEDKKHAFINGASIENTWKWEISTELSLESTLDAFIGYLDPDPDTQIDWELIFNMRVNKYLSTKINTDLRYYTTEDKDIQWKEYLAISFNLSF